MSKTTGIFKGQNGLMVGAGDSQALNSIPGHRGGCDGHSLEQD